MLVELYMENISISNIAKSFEPFNSTFIDSKFYEMNNKFDKHLLEGVIKIFQK